MISAVKFFLTEGTKEGKDDDSSDDEEVSPLMITLSGTQSGVHNKEKFRCSSVFMYSDIFLG